MVTSSRCDACCFHRVGRGRSQAAHPWPRRPATTWPGLDAPDFLDFSSREAIDKALQRLAQASQLSRIDRGPVRHLPRVNPLLGGTSSHAGRSVAALLKNTLLSDHDRVLARLSSFLADPKHGKAIRDDLRQGISTLPSWMQAVVEELLDEGTDHSRLRRRQGAPPARSRAKHREAPRRDECGVQASGAPAQWSRRE